MSSDLRAIWGEARGRGDEVIARHWWIAAVPPFVVLVAELSLMAVMVHGATHLFWVVGGVAIGIPAAADTWHCLLGTVVPRRSKPSVR